MTKNDHRTEKIYPICQPSNQDGYKQAMMALQEMAVLNGFNDIISNLTKFYHTLGLFKLDNSNQGISILKYTTC